MNKQAEIKSSPGIITAGIGFKITVIALLSVIILGVGAIYLREQPVKTIHRVETETIIRYIVGMDVNTEIENAFKKDQHKKVYDYFNKITGNDEVTRNILHYAIKQDVPINLVMAIIYTESRFNPEVENYNEDSDSFDRGLGGLNDRAFPWIRPIDRFFNIPLNVENLCEWLEKCYKETNKNKPVEHRWAEALSRYNAYDPDNGWFYSAAVQPQERIYDKLFNEEF